MVIPLWQHPLYKGSRTRLRLIRRETFPAKEAIPVGIATLHATDFASFRLKAVGAEAKARDRDELALIAIARSTESVDSSFTCPITGDRLSECACMKSSLKLHDFCVFCPAVRLSS